MKQACRQTLKSLAAECLVGVRLGCWILDSCLRGLIVLVACIWCRWLFVLDRCRWHTSWILVGGLVPRKCFFCWYEHSYNFYPAPNVNLGIDREGTAKSQDGQQKGTLAHVKRKVATALSMKVKPVLKYKHSCALAPISAVEACLENSPSSLHFCLVAISMASRLPRSLLRSLPPGSSWKIICFAKFAWSRTEVAKEDANAFPSCRKRALLR